MLENPVDGEGSGNAQTLIVRVRLVEKCFGLSATGDGGSNLFGFHTLTNTGIVGYRLECYAGRTSVNETLPEVALDARFGRHQTGGATTQPGNVNFPLPRRLNRSIFALASSHCDVAPRSTVASSLSTSSCPAPLPWKAPQEPVFMHTHKI